MKTIWKYELSINDEQQIDVPLGAEPVFVANQDNRLCLWAIVDSLVPMATMNVSVRGTGHPIGDGRKYVGSAMIGPFVWHVFTDNTR